MKKILVIDDDVHINEMLYDMLTKEGFLVLRAWSGTEALLILENNNPDLILLDLMLPGLTGEELLPKIKDIPVIVLSAKASVDDKISLLSSGALDYITKPFDRGELLARINVQLRRKSLFSGTVFKYNDIEIDMVSYSAKINNQTVALTKTEFALLKLFVQAPEKVLAKSYILEAISLDTPDCTEYSLKQHISNLRKKLKQYSSKEGIESVWGIGFVFK
ncbi:MAG: response regulator transcription factor [Eubacterium sp.]